MRQQPLPQFKKQKKKETQNIHENSANKYLSEKKISEVLFPCGIKNEKGFFPEFEFEIRTHEPTKITLFPK